MTKEYNKESFATEDGNVFDFMMSTIRGFDKKTEPFYEYCLVTDFEEIKKAPFVFGVPCPFVQVRATKFGKKYSQSRKLIKDVCLVQFCEKEGNAQLIVLIDPNAKNAVAFTNGRKGEFGLDGASSFNSKGLVSFFSEIFSTLVLDNKNFELKRVFVSPTFESVKGTGILETIASAIS